MVEHRVLIVEDEEGLAIHLQFLLRRMGYEPLGPAETGECAIQMAGEFQPDVILMDVYLAGIMTGIEAAQAIHARWDLPVIYLTAVADDDTLRDAQASSPYAYLIKPAQERDLHAAIELALYKHQLDVRLRESEERYRLLFETMINGFALQEILLDEQGQPVDGRILAVNPAFEQVTGLQPGGVVGKRLSEVLPVGVAFFVDIFRRLLREGPRIQFEGYSPDLGRFFEVSAYAPKAGQVAVILADITERVLSQEAVQESETRFRQLAEGVSEVFWLSDRHEGRLLYVSPACERVFGVPSQALYQHSNLFYDCIHPEDRGRVQMAMSALHERMTVFNEEYRVLRPDGSQRWVWARSFPVQTADGEVVRFSGIAEDMTERKQAEQEIMEGYRRTEQHLRRLMILRNIDQAIVTHTDFNTMAEVVLNHIVEMNEIDAALLFMPADPDLSFQETLRLAALAGLARELLDAISLNWLRQVATRVFHSIQPLYGCHCEEQSDLGAQMLKSKSGFSSGSMLPLEAKGQVRGVLVLLRRCTNGLDADLNNFMQSLALQTAIALDNIEMTQGLRRSHEKLSHAYEATIRGWAQALELRDKETRGHSERVVRLASRLARELGMSEQELTHFLRGVLLHDIGKMAIPDSILLKPGPLSADEWVLMRLHPVYAYDMLSQIDYLKPALDVPYYHHERWDGSGYPVGLKGEAIPWPARIFTVVDAWDALTSGRPYRPAWSRQDALQYLNEQSGRQFDPQVMRVFLKLIDE